MQTLLDRLPPGSRISVIRLRSLGDCVLTTPALAVLKAHRPDVRVAVVVEDRFRELFEGNPDIEALLPPAVTALRRFRPRLALNLHGGTRSMVLTAASGARFRAGFAHHRYSFLYSAKIPRAQQILGEERRVHTAEHIASAMFWLGVPQGPIPRAKLAPGPAPEFSARGHFSERGHFPERSYAVLHPFASRLDKTWPPWNFVAVARQLKESGLEPVFLAGPGDDASAFGEFEVWTAAPLERVKGLMAGAHLFIGNDSGPAHIAAAFGIPVVALFGNSDVAVWSPWRTEARVLASPLGIGSIAVEEVLEAAHSLGVRT